jgi:hypothetical protein
MAERLISEQLQQTLRHANTIGGEFLVTDVELALTMLDRASTAGDEAVAARNVQNAWRAYETVMELRARLKLEDPQREHLDARLAVLKQRLDRESESAG